MIDPGAEAEPLAGPEPDPVPAEQPAGWRGVVATVDKQVDEWFDHVRGHPAWDGVPNVVTALADHGI